ncbi:MAG: hypothetical protein IAG10_01490 [Planctomycetaceae bacterium]|nr:hypothetical protein [Planctomycetaceae bacterium]
MTTLNRANRELYGRGRDEAFAAHNDLHDQCRQEKQNASDVWQPPHTLQPQLLERLTDAVNRLADEVRVVRDVLDETREDLGWLTRNGLPNQTTVHTQLVRMARDPLAFDANERLEFRRFVFPNASCSTLASEQFDELVSEIAEVVTGTGQEQINLLLGALDDMRVKLVAAIKPHDHAQDTDSDSQDTVTPAPRSPAKQGELF